MSRETQLCTCALILVELQTQKHITHNTVLPIPVTQSHTLLFRGCQNTADMSSSSESESEVENTPDIDTTEKDEDTTDSSDKTFASLGLVDVLCEACEKVGWKKPSRIQAEAIPVALKGNDVIGLAETGSGKTGSFVLPILQALLENPQKLFACILTPTRELAFQISEQIEALGATIGKPLTP